MLSLSPVHELSMILLLRAGCDLKANNRDSCQCKRILVKCQKNSSNFDVIDVDNRICHLCMWGWDLD